MSFTEEIIQKVWVISKGKCECRRGSHNHPYGRCGQELVFEDKGKDLPSGWEAHRINSYGDYALNNCEILCMECYKDTFDY